VRRPSLLPRSAGVVAATVGAVLVLGIQADPGVPAPRHPDAPERAASALEPVIPAPREEARLRSTAPVTGASVAGAHLQGAGPLR
jgi:hypothetical protein